MKQRFLLIVGILHVCASTATWQTWSSQWQSLVHFSSEASFQQENPPQGYKWKRMGPD